MKIIEPVEAMLDFLMLSQSCAPSVHPDTMYRLVRVESSFNPYAIGVVGAHLASQPRTRDEAIDAARWLGSHGYNYSVGLAQINVKNFAAHGLDETTAFDPCRNLYASSVILSHCYRQALQRTPEVQRALREALSCYEAGNFNSGFKDGYVQKLVNATSDSSAAHRLPGPLVRKALVESAQVQAPSALFTISPASPSPSLPHTSLR